MKIMVIDGNSILNRAFYGIRQLTNHEGLPTNAVYGFLATLFKLQDEEQPDRTIVCFDVKEKTFRHLKFDTYKATRKGMPDELAAQLPITKQVLDALGVTRCELAGYEADDLLGTISRRADEHGDTCVVVTGDRDSLQLVGGGTTVMLVSTRMGQTTYQTYDTAAFREKYGFDPIHLIDLKALMGDSSDNIPGVPGIGEKTAMQLLHDFGTLEGVYANIDDERIKKGARAKLQAGEQSARDSYWLATIDRSVPLDLDVEHLPAQDIDETALYDLLTRLEFKNFIKRFDLSGESVSAPRLPELKTERVENVLEAFNLMDSLTDCDRVYAIVPETLGAVCLLDGDTAHILFAEAFGDAWNDILRRLFDGTLSLVLHDAKAAVRALLQRGMDPKGIVFDTAIAAYLLDPTQSGYDLPRLALAYCNTELPELDLDDPAALSPLGGREETGRSAAQYLAAMREIFREMNDKIEQLGMRRLYYEIELPLERVLAEMENAGCAVAPDALRTFGERLETRIRDLVEQIYLDAGAEFNLNSTRQLGEILFERLGLPAPKKTKTGYSTSAEVLEKLAPECPFVADILEYRQLTKLKSTYADGLATFIGPDGRIHGKFNQTITATGRISSTEPNLQNIPVRMELGRLIRKVFVPKEGCVFVDADYSQIELRILAHCSGDEQLIQAYREARDIHRMTASQVFHVPFDEVTDLQRRNAKAVNFGIVYGISSFGLSQDLSITRKEAARYIEHYFETYPGIKTFLDQCVADAKEKGYAVTLFGRRRPVPELKSSNFMQRSFGERVAMNAPIQGTAADIIKIAMIRVSDEMKKQNMKSRMILQVHDELLIEAAEEEVDEVKKILKEEMEHAASLSVPLLADMHTGKNWYEAK